MLKFKLPEDFSPICFNFLSGNRKISLSIPGKNGKTKTYLTATSEEVLNYVESLGLQDLVKTQSRGLKLACVKYRLVDLLLSASISKYKDLFGGKAWPVNKDIDL